MDKLQWGNRKRLRCVKVKESTVMNGKSSDGNGIVVKKKITSQRVDRRVVNEQDSHHPLPPLHASSPQRLNRKIMSALSSPEKEDRYYTTRGSGGGFDDSSSSKKVLNVDTTTKKESKRAVWPKLFTTLSSKEKEEDFMAMKGCKLPQRPKKRAKMIQRTLLLVSPGAWLSDLCQERYEVREKKTSKKVVNPFGQILSNYAIMTCTFMHYKLNIDHGLVAYPFAKSKAIIQKQTWNIFSESCAFASEYGPLWVKPKAMMLC